MIISRIYILRNTMISARLSVKKKDPSIIIIGAGAAGLSAAVRLIDNGFKNVKILEAEDRIGGRLYSVPLGDSVVDLGAHWVHGEQGNAVYEMAKPLKLIEQSGDFSNVHFILSNKSEVDPNTGMAIFMMTGELLGDHTKLTESKGSVQDFLIECYKEVAKDSLTGDAYDAYLDWLIKFECTIEGCDSLTEPSAKGLSHYKQCPGDVVNHWNGGGYTTLVDLILRRHKSSKLPPIVLGDRLKLNTEVKEIDWSGMQVFVKCNKATVYFCDHVIITMSLGVLKEKYKALFKPPLPLNKRRAIMGLGIGTVNKVYLRFPYPWWPEGCSGFSLLWLKGDKELQNVGNDHFKWELDIIGFYTESGSPKTLTAWLVGDAAREMESYTIDNVKKGCYRILKKFLSFRHTIPEPIDAVRSAWYSNPNFRGSYSYQSMSSEAMKVKTSDLAEPLKNDLGREAVLFAGEATHSEFYSTAHGAVETGWREANRLLEIYAEPKKNMSLTSENLRSNL